MIKEFEARTEKEAIDKAVADLNLDREEFDVEIVESSRKSLFRKGSVKIRVHIDSEDESAAGADPENDFERGIIQFIEELIEHMGFPGKVEIDFREERKIGISIISEHTSILIGRKGKNLDAIQLLANVFAGKQNSNLRIIIDAENYRSRHEESIIRMAKKVADQVRKSKRSKLLEPMNPFERRLVHTALNDMVDIETKSEGDGLYKQVRILYKGSNY